MILRLFRRPDTATFNGLYGAIVAQARLPVFYGGFGVSDTVEGRFDETINGAALADGRLAFSDPDAILADADPFREIR